MSCLLPHPLLTAGKHICKQAGDTQLWQVPPQLAEYPWLLAAFKISLRSLFHGAPVALVIEPPHLPPPRPSSATKPGFSLLPSMSVPSCPSALAHAALISECPSLADKQGRPSATKPPRTPSKNWAEGDEVGGGGWTPGGLSHQGFSSSSPHHPAQCVQQGLAC